MMGSDVTEEGAPFTYITLTSTDPSANKAQWVFGNGTITTTFDKVQFDPITLRIETGDFTFAQTTIDDNINTAAYFNSHSSYDGCFQPLRAAGTNTTNPDFLAVPYGIAGLCQATGDGILVTDDYCTYPFAAIPQTPKANINLTGTGLRLIDNAGLDFLYCDDNFRDTQFTGASPTFEYNQGFCPTPAGTTNFSSGNAIMETQIEYILDAFDSAVGFCKWVTTQIWFTELYPLTNAGSIFTRSKDIRSGSGTLCVCKDTSGNANCTITDCTYAGSSFQLHLYPINAPTNAPTNTSLPQIDTVPPPTSDTSSLSTPAIIGIAVGCVAALGIIGTFIYMKTASVPFYAVLSGENFM